VRFNLRQLLISRGGTGEKNLASLVREFIDLLREFIDLVREFIDLVREFIDSVWNMIGFRLRLNEPASLQTKK